MAENTRIVVLPSLAVVDIVAHNSNSVDVSYASAYQLEVNSSLNQAGNIQQQISQDGGNTWVNYGTPIAVAATAGLFMPAMGTLFPVGFIRFVYTATVAPTAGTIALALHLVSK